MTNEEFCRLHSAYNGEKITNIKQLVSENFNGEELKEFVDFCIEQSKLSQHDVSKRKFAVEWMRNVNYGIGSGTEYFDAETREEALKLFWNGRNKEAFEVNTI